MYRVFSCVVVIVYQIASQYAKVVEATKQTMDKNDGRIIVLVLCSLLDLNHLHLGVCLYLY